MSETSTAEAPPVRWKTFGAGDSARLLIVDASRVYDISADFRDALDRGDPEAIGALTPTVAAGPLVDMAVPAPMPPQSLSLNVSSSCNLACSYCYAARGGFDGAQTRHMTWPTAKAAIDKLLSNCAADAPVTIGYLGGEPFVNRRLIRRATAYAAKLGGERRLDVRFSVTTNGELLEQEDRALLRTHPFAVTFSVDGGRARHERQRPGADFDALKRNAVELLADPGEAQICARATITRDNLDLIERFDAISELGFGDIGFSPVRVGPERDRLHGEDWRACLDAFKHLGEREAARLKSSGNTAFSNLAVALKQIHRGACSPYPCGAGGGYFSVAADGRWFACHRAIGDQRFAMGDSSGLDQGLRERFLRSRHVENQIDCKTCWARYLCSGSCHQEAEARNADSCGFIRGWLEFCLDVYADLDGEVDNFPRVI